VSESGYGTVRQALASDSKPASWVFRSRVHADGRKVRLLVSDSPANLLGVCLTCYRELNCPFGSFGRHEWSVHFYARWNEVEPFADLPGLPFVRNKPSARWSR
jgi:hypothetical protein